MRDFLAESMAASAAKARRAAIAYAWQLWRQYLCEEATGGHPWVLHVRQGAVTIECEHECGARPFDDPDHLFMTVSVPVAVEVDAGRYPTDYGSGWEWDMAVVIDPDPDRIPRWRF